MLIKSKAIVLRSLKYGDQKLIVDFYTEAYGRLTSAIKISQTAKGKMKKQLFQPLTFLDLEIDYRLRSELQQVKDVQIAMPWTTLNVDPVKMTVGMFLAEVLCYAVRAEQQDDNLFQFITTSMRWLDMSDTGTANFHIAFLVRMTRLLGWDICHADEAYMIGDVQNITFDTLDDYPMSRERRQACLHVLLEYYRNHCPSFPEVKSLEILQALYD